MRARKPDERGKRCASSATQAERGEGGGGPGTDLGGGPMYIHEYVLPQSPS